MKNVEKLVFLSPINPGVVVKSETGYASADVNVEQSLERDNKIHDARKEKSMPLDFFTLYYCGTVVSVTTTVSWTCGNSNGIFYISLNLSNRFKSGVCTHAHVPVDTYANIQIRFFVSLTKIKTSIR